MTVPEKPPREPLRLVRDGAPTGGEPLPDAVARAAAAWREEVPVRAEWRAALHQAIEAESPHARRADAPPADAAPALARLARQRRMVALALGLAAALLIAVGLRARLVAPDAVREDASAHQAALAHDTGPAAASPAAAPDRVGDASPVRFSFVAPGARRVALVGDFNDCDPARMPLRSLGDGRTWVLDVALRPGRHAYAFVVDGDLAADPAAPRAPDDDFGVPSSVVLVLGGN